MSAPAAVGGGTADAALERHHLDRLVAGRSPGHRRGLAGVVAVMSSASSCGSPRMDRSGWTRPSPFRSPGSRCPTSAEAFVTTAIRRCTTSCSTGGRTSSGQVTSPCVRCRGCSSIAALPLMWAAGRRLGGRTTATIAVLLLARVSPFAIRYATEARMYSLVTLLALAGYLAVVRGPRVAATAAPRLVVLISAALVLTHYWDLYLTGVRPRRGGGDRLAGSGGRRGRGRSGHRRHRRRRVGLPALAQLVPRSGSAHRHAVGPDARTCSRRPSECSSASAAAVRVRSGCSSGLCWWRWRWPPSSTADPAASRSRVVIAARGVAAVLAVTVGTALVGMSAAMVAFVVLPGSVRRRAAAVRAAGRRRGGDAAPGTDPPPAAPCWSS